MGLSLFPITNPLMSDIPPYLLMATAMANGFTITEISEQGRVSQLLARNTLYKDVLLVDGEEIVGAKQNRTLNLSMLLPAQSEIHIPVSCVERGRWQYQSRAFTPSNRLQFASSRSRKMASVSRSLAANQLALSDQKDVWADIDEKLEQSGTRSPTAAMGDIACDREAILNEYAQALQTPEHTVGAIFALGNKIIGLELFNYSETFTAFLSKTVRAYAMDAELTGVTGGECGYDDASRFLNHVMDCDGEAYPAPGIGHTVRIAGNGLSGASLIVGEQCLHTVVFRQ
jgi:hypothetical protein